MSKAKAKPKTRRASNPIAVDRPTEKPSVNIKAAENGYTISSYGPKGETIKVATSSAGAMRAAREMLEGKK